MTNAEAIETLRANYPDACFEQLREAVDAAIEALKAQGTAGQTMYNELVERLGAKSYTLEELSIILPRAADVIEELMRKCEQLPSADAVPVVLCKDCKWWIPHGKETPASIPAFGECQFKDRKFGTVCWEFCSWGERKDDE